MIERFMVAAAMLTVGYVGFVIFGQHRGDRSAQATLIAAVIFSAVMALVVAAAL